MNNIEKVFEGYRMECLRTNTPTAFVDKAELELAALRERVVELQDGLQQVTEALGEWKNYAPAFWDAGDDEAMATARALLAKQEAG
jgi:hypothetical protein